MPSGIRKIGGTGFIFGMRIASSRPSISETDEESPSSVSDTVK